MPCVPFSPWPSHQSHFQNTMPARSGKPVTTGRAERAHGRSRCQAMQAPDPAKTSDLACGDAASDCVPASGRMVLSEGPDFVLARAVTARAATRSRLEIRRRHAPQLRAFEKGVVEGRGCAHVDRPEGEVVHLQGVLSDRIGGFDADCPARLSHHDDIAAFVPGLDIDVCLDEVGQRVDPVHDR